MIDIKLIRTNPEIFKKACADKHIPDRIDEILDIDARLKQTKQELQDIVTAKNAAGKEIARIKDPAEKKAAVEKMNASKGREKELSEITIELEKQLEALMLRTPQPASPYTPVGPDASGNVVVRSWGKVREFGFEPKDHVTLGLELGILDVERGVKLAGSRNYILKGAGCLLHRAVLSLAHDTMVAKGFEPLTVPVMTREETFLGTGWFPEGKEQVYQVPADELFLVGTAEVPVTSLYSGEILDVKDLPLKYVAQSLCFRREAGSAGKDTSGLYRIHQFEKVEQVIICKNEDEESEKWHQQIVVNSEEVLQKLNLPHHVLEICTGDMGSAKYRMYDIETWMPSRKAYCETHSASNLHEFQARRLNLRFRDTDGTIKFCHTLNNTVVASPRILIAIMELYQNQDGSITVPDALKPYMCGVDVIRK